MRVGDWAEPAIGLPQSESVGEVELESVQFLLHSTRKAVLDRLALNDGCLSGSGPPTKPGSEPLPRLRTCPAPCRPEASGHGTAKTRCCRAGIDSQWWGRHLEGSQQMTALTFLAGVCAAGLNLPMRPSSRPGLA